MLDQTSYFKEFYKRIIAGQLGFDPSRDSIAPQYISSIVDCNTVEKAWRNILNSFKSNEALVVGPVFDSCHDHLTRRRAVVIGADGSSLLYYYRTGRFPDITVSDLDGPLIMYKLIIQHDKWIVVHSHGDNIFRLAMLSSLLEYDKAVFTTQTETYKCVKNIGGFTDGDRAILLAILMGFRKVRVCCFSNRPVRLHKEAARVNDYHQKRSKLELASRIIEKIKEVYPDRVEFIS